MRIIEWLDLEVILRKLYKMSWNKENENFQFIYELNREKS